MGCNATHYPDVTCFTDEAPPLVVTGPGGVRESGALELVERLNPYAALVRFRPEAPFEAGESYLIAYDDSARGRAAQFTYGALPSTDAPFAELLSKELERVSPAGTLYTCESGQCDSSTLELGSERVVERVLFASLSNVPGRLVAIVPGRDADERDAQWDLWAQVQEPLSVDEERCVTAFARDVLSETVSKQVVCMTASAAAVREPNPRLESELRGCMEPPQLADTGDAADALLPAWCAGCPDGACAEGWSATCADVPSVSERSAPACNLGSSHSPSGALAALLGFAGLVLRRRALQRRG